MTPAVAASIAAQLGVPLGGITPAGNGFTRNWRARAGDEPVFIKLAADTDRLAAEADGLVALADCRELVIPRVLARGEAAGASFLVMTWLPLAGGGDPARLGAAIAALHAIHGPSYGWRRDNYLGATPQANGQENDWASFFAHRRLAPQLSMAAGRGFAAVAGPGRHLLAALPDLMAGHQPPAALLHGDLWHGNTGSVGGRPAVFDPAVHYGDPECDLAMAALFGGFAPAFFATHATVHPPLPGWQRRRRLYQLYHLLNHLNLFGSGYLGSVLEILEELT